MATTTSKTTTSKTTSSKATRSAAQPTTLDTNAPLPDRLEGEFLECCDCRTICPCWVEEAPDEDHCSGIYVWSFAPTAAIKGESLNGRAVAIAAYHGKDGGAQSVLYVDDRLSKQAQDALTDAFGGRKPMPRFAHLKKLIGTVVQVQPARIDRVEQAPNWTVTISVSGQTLAQATGADDLIDGKSPGVTLANTALHQEFQLVGPARVQKVSRLQVSMSTLPGGAFAYTGRAGMAGTFDYADGLR